MIFVYFLTSQISFGTVSMTSGITASLSIILANADKERKLIKAGLLSVNILQNNLQFIEITNTN